MGHFENIDLCGFATLREQRRWEVSAPMFSQRCKEYHLTSCHETFFSSSLIAVSIAEVSTEFFPVCPVMIVFSPPLYVTVSSFLIGREVMSRESGSLAKSLSARISVRAAKAEASTVAVNVSFFGACFTPFTVESLAVTFVAVPSEEKVTVLDDEELFAPSILLNAAGLGAGRLDIDDSR